MLDRASALRAARASMTEHATNSIGVDAIYRVVNAVLDDVEEQTAVFTSWPAEVWLITDQDDKPLRVAITRARARRWLTDYKNKVIARHLLRFHIRKIPTVLKEES